MFPPPAPFFWDAHGRPDAGLPADEAGLRPRSSAHGSTAGVRPGVRLQSDNLQVTTFSRSTMRAGFPDRDMRKPHGHRHEGSAMSEQTHDEHPLEEDYPDGETLEEEIPLDVDDDEDADDDEDDQ